MNEREIMKAFEKLILENMKKIVDKGDVTPAEIVNMKEAYCLMNEMTKHMNQDMAEDYDMDNSQRRSGANYRMRNMSMRSGNYYPGHDRGWYGTYSVNRSGHSDTESRIRDLEQRRMNAASDSERMLIDEWIEQLEMQR